MQDRDPSQNSVTAKRAMANCNCNMTLIQIPPRSPDLNPIENFFNIVRCKLNDALHLKIAIESFEEFQTRVIRTIYSIPVQIIKKTKLLLEYPSGSNRLLTGRDVGPSIKLTIAINTNFNC